MSPPRRMWCALVAVWVASAFDLRAAPPLPIIPTNVFNITNYGAFSASTNNATAIQAAIAAAHTAGGGIVEVPAGTFLSGPFLLTNNINLQIDGGGILQMLAFGVYPGTNYFIVGNKLKNIEISGAGTIDGQGSAWWTYYTTNHSLGRPYMIYLSGCNTVLVQNVMLQNPPAQHLVFKSNGGNITIQSLTINTSGSSPNTDGVDLVGTNCLVQNCSINAGDDNIAVGSTAGASVGILITNCVFGTGHGVSIGSDTSGGVSNMVVANCSFTGTVNGIRMKSDNDRGGLVRNISYYNLPMTNVGAPVVIFSYYNEDETPNGTSPAGAASQPVGSLTGTMPIWENIIISNVTATTSFGAIAGMIWGRTELAVSNVVFDDVKISASAPFALYNARGIEWLDSQISLPAGNPTFELYNATATVTNSGPSSNVVSLDGLAGTNSLAFYNESASMTDSNAIGATPISLGSGTLSVSNSLEFTNPTVLNFVVGTNNSEIVASGDLALNNTVNITNGAGFGAGNYTLLSYGGALSGTASLGTVPTVGNYIYTLDSSIAQKVRLLVQAPPGQPSFGSIGVVGGALHISASGPPGDSFVIYGSTNTATPMSLWTPVVTNMFDGTGRSTITLTLPGSAQEFYDLRLVP